MIDLVVVMCVVLSSVKIERYNTIISLLHANTYMPVEHSSYQLVQWSWFW